MMVGGLNGLNTIAYERYKHIGIIYQYVVNSVKLMVLEHYDTPEYDNTLFFLNVYPLIDDVGQDVLQSYSRKIFYFLEHRLCDGVYHPGHGIYDYNLMYNLPIIEQFGITEMWTMDYEPQFAKMCYDKLSIPYVYKPVRYTSLIKEVDNIYTTPKNIDCCFVGVCGGLCPARTDIITELEEKHYFSLKIITQSKNMDSVISEMNSCKYMLDLPRIYEHATQNQTRIFELLCMGYTVCGKKYELNMFPGLIYEWDNVHNLSEIVKNNEYLHPIEAYKEMTYTNEAYEKYVNNLVNLQHGIQGN